MNNSRNLVILVVVLVVLGGINLLQRTAHHKDTSRAATEVLVQDNFKADDLDRITLGWGPDQVVVDLVKNPDGWVVASSWQNKATESRIDGLLKAVNGLSGEFRSDKAEVIGDYGLADSTAVHMRFYQHENPVISLEVGNRSQGQQGNFVRKTGDNTVYLSTVNLLSPLGIYSGPEMPKDRQFLDLQAVKEDRLAVNSITLHDGKHTLEMQKIFAMVAPDSTAPEGSQPQANRSSWEWKLVKPRQASLAKTKADGVLGTTVNIRATDVSDPGVESSVYGLDKPTRTATLAMADGSTIVLEFGAQRPTEGDHPAGTWMRVKGQNTVWVVADYVTNNIFKSVDDLLPEE